MLITSLLNQSVRHGRVANLMSWGRKGYGEKCPRQSLPGIIRFCLTGSHAVMHDHEHPESRTCVSPKQSGLRIEAQG